MRCPGNFGLGIIWIARNPPGAENSPKADLEKWNWNIPGGQEIQGCAVGWQLLISFISLI